MCGIVGFSKLNHSIRNDQELIIKGLSSLKHRGPDEAGFYTDDKITLGHARLAIVSPDHGKQPFSASGRAEILVYNGEIFNHEELTKLLNLNGVFLDSASDTELLYWLLVTFGKNVISKINGQFSFCFWSPISDYLLLARDSFGEKPLFYKILSNGDIAFASEIKSLIAMEFVDVDVNLDQLFSISNYWSVLPNDSIFNNVNQLPASSILEYKSGVYSHDFFKPEQTVSSPLQDLISRSVNLRLRSDVPLGVMLSGGLDSTIIACEICSSIPSKNVKSFSVDFSSDEFSERKFQHLASDFFSTEHHEINFGVNDLIADFDDALYFAESPSHRFAFVSLYSLYKKIKSTGIKVILSGEGADEIFMGYDIFTEAFITQSIASGSSFEDLESFIIGANSFMPNSNDYQSFIMAKFANFSSLSELNTWNVSHLNRKSLGALFRNFFNHNTKDNLDNLWYQFFELKYENFSELSILEKSQLIEINTLLSGHLLSTQGDRISMGNSIEARMPFLDPLLSKYASNLPIVNTFFSSMVEKSLLKDLYRNKIPSEIISRKKFPFRAPDSNLLQNKQGLDFVSDSLMSINDFDFKEPNKVSDFLLDSCRSKTFLNPRQNFAFTLLLTLLRLPNAINSRVKQLKLNYHYELRSKTSFGSLFDIKDWKLLK